MEGVLLKRGHLRPKWFPNAVLVDPEAPLIGLLERVDSTVSWSQGSRGAPDLIFGGFLSHGGTHWVVPNHPF